jgi:major membrane immunogen (membrane-anchored lipoprotein)
MDDEFASSGWKEAVTLTVAGGKITKADWNGVNVSGGADKKTYDKAGKYNMVKFGKAQAEWSVQAEKAEKHLLATQDPTAISYKDAEGHTDDIAGVSVHVNGLFNLAQKALAAGPVGRGSLSDGAYFAIDEQFGSSGWKEYVSLTVLNGRIAAINWSGVNRSGDDKKAFDKAGNYNMVKFGKAQDEWSVQATRAENFLVEKQDLKAIKYKDAEGHTDDIAGVSIHVSSMYALVEEALASGVQKIGPYANGSYYASEEAFGSNGWKGFVSLFVSNGNIVEVYYSGVNEAGDDKQVFASEGKYGMIKGSKLGKEWHEQAQATEAYLIATQDPKKVKFSNAEGNTDDIAGVSMHVGDFFTLTEKALAAGPKK